MTSEVVQLLVWPTFPLALLIFGLAPSIVLRIIVLAFRSDDPRRTEMLGELYSVPRIERPFWVLEQLEIALFEGLGGRLRGVIKRRNPVDQKEYEVMRQTIEVDLDAEILRAEMRQALRDGLAELPARDQWLLQLRSSDPPKSYHEIGQLLDMPVASIRPTLRQCLDRLGNTEAMLRYTDKTGPIS